MILFERGKRKIKRNFNAHKHNFWIIVKYKEICMNKANGKIYNGKIIVTNTSSLHT